MRVVILAFIGTGLWTVAAPPAVAAPSSSDAGYVNTKKPCNWKKYRSHFKVKVKKKSIRPVLTHIRTYSMPPGSARERTRWAAHSTTLRATVTFDQETSAGVSGLGKVIAQANAKVKLGLRAMGKRTSNKRVKVRDTIANNTGKNQAFVFFAGRTQVKGTFRYMYCEQQTRRSHWTIHYRPGKWQSYAVLGDGALRCGAGHRTKLEALALKVGCA